MSSPTALRAALCVGATYLLAGCAQSVGDIDRTQPDLLPKSVFEGQWFVRETVVDVPETSTAAFAGSMGNLETIVWEIREDRLVGYRAYEYLPGTESEANTGVAQPNYQPVASGRGDGRDPDQYRGQPVVSYRITTHADVIRQYNSRTGEQTNVITENTSDRPWYERDYIRVDWSRNELGSFDFEPYQFWPMFGAMLDAEEFVPTNEGGADAFRMEDAAGEPATGDEVSYIDFTVRRAVQPSPLGCAQARQQQMGDCGAALVKVRTSMVKVDSAREQDYVPMVWDDQRMGEFGYFRTERPTYDRRLSVTFPGLIQVANRHDLWENAYDELGNPLPMWQRKLRPIVYTLSSDFPADLRPVAESMAAELDSEFRDVAAAARGQNMDEFLADLRDDTGAECVFCLDTNEDGRWRNGDLRRNFIYWINDPQMTGPLGYGPSSVNPETGRIISASAYVYGAGVDTYAEYAKQLVDLLNGQVDETSITGGEYFRNAVLGGLKPVDPRSSAPFEGLGPDALARKVLGNKGFNALKTFEELGASALQPAIPGYEAAQLNKVVGTPIEAMMIPEEWVELAKRNQLGYLQLRAEARGETGVNPVTGLPEYLSIKNWMWGGASEELEQFRRIADEHSACFTEFTDPLLTGLARQAQRRGLTGDALYQNLREEIFRGVMLHEIGHTLGLRHNFGASADPLNYHEEYWPERNKTILPYQAQGLLAPTTDPDDVDPQAPRPDGVAAFLRSNCSVQGPLTDRTTGQVLAGTDNTGACAEQQEAGMAEFQYSSIMDYGGRPNSDFKGLGHYDRAALAAGYGDLVEVFSEEAMAGIQAGSAAVSARIGAAVDVREALLRANEVRTPVLGEGLDSALVRQSNAGAFVAHYTNYPELFGGIENMAKRRFMPRTEYNRLLQEGEQKSVADRQLDVVKVPYVSCYDEYRGSVDVCDTWDVGSDNYEITSNYLQGYREYYIFNNFSRERIGYDAFDVFNRVRGRYLMPIARMYQHFFWNAAATGLGGLETAKGQLGLLAAREGLNTLLDTLAVPAYGMHGLNPTTGRYQELGGTCAELVADVTVPGPDGAPGVPMPECINVPQGVGRSLFSRFDSTRYDVFRRMTEAGHFYDQMAALQALSLQNASIVGIGADVNADSNTFRIPYNLLYEGELDQLFAAVYREDLPAYSMRVLKDQSGVTHVQPHSVFLSPEASGQMQTAPVIEAQRSFTTRIQSIVAGSALTDGRLTSTFANRGQISLKGSGEQREVPAGFEIVEAADPASGRVFYAYRGTAADSGPWYAADTLQQLNEVNAELAALGPEPAPDAPEEAQDVAAARRSANNRLERLIGDVELMRQVSNIFRQ